MTERDPAARTHAPASGVARGSLGTGTAVDDETQVWEVPEITWRPSGPPNLRPSSRVSDGETPAPAPVAPAAVPRLQAGTAHAAPARDRSGTTARSTAIALAAVFVALLGVAVLTTGRQDSASVVPPPAAVETPDGDPKAQADQGANDKGGNQGNGGGRGNGNGRGPDGNNGRGNDP